MEKYGRAGQATDGNIIRRKCIAFWISKATNTHSQYVILIAFPLQQQLHEHASMLRSTYNTLPVLCKIKMNHLASYMQLFTQQQYADLLE